MRNIYSQIFLSNGILGITGVVVVLAASISGSWFWFFECYTLSFLICFMPTIIYQMNKQIQSKKEIKEKENAKEIKIKNKYVIQSSQNKLNEQDKDKVEKFQIKGKDIISENKRKIGEVGSLRATFFIYFGSILSNLYIFLLPYLSGFNYANKKENWNNQDVYTISSYLNTTQATGFMAGLFYYPFFIIWDTQLQIKKYVNFIQKDILWVLIPLTSFFFLFLIVNQERYYTLNIWIYFLFKISSLAYLTIIKQMVKNNLNLVSGLLFIVAVFGILVLIILYQISFWTNFNNFGKLIYIVECITLTALIWYTPSLILDQKSHKEQSLPNKEIICNDKTFSTINNDNENKTIISETFSTINDDNENKAIIYKDTQNTQNIKMNLYRFDDNEDKKIISKDTENTQNIKMNLYSFDDRENIIISKDTENTQNIQTNL